MRFGENSELAALALHYHPAATAGPVRVANNASPTDFAGSVEAERKTSSVVKLVTLFSNSLLHFWCK